MEHLFEIQRIILEQFEQQPFYDRAIFRTFALDNYICGLVGTRGIGKTTFLLNHVLQHGGKQRKALYISADHVYFLDKKLIDLVDTLYKETDVRLLCIDEIHKYQNWRQELKNISDIYFDFRIVFTGSSKIDLVSGHYDLSRRVTLYHLHGLSFREYLFLTLKQEVPKITFDELIHSYEKIADAIRIPHLLKHFQTYLVSGYYPFFNRFSQNQEKFQAIDNVIKKTIYEDIGTLHSLKTSTLRVIEKLYQFVINSAPGEINASKLASNLGKDFNNISDYLSYLEQAGLIRFLYPFKSGQAFLRNPVKMYPENTNMLYAAYLPITYDNLLGKARETFVINQIQNAGFPIYYSEKGDFKIADYLVEVGGKNKTLEQIKDQKNAFLLSDGILTGSKQRIPLYLLGFLN